MNVVQSLQEAPAYGRSQRVVHLDDIVQLVKLGQKLREQGNAVLVDRDNRRLIVWQIEEAA